MLGLDATDDPLYGEQEGRYCQRGEMENRLRELPGRSLRRPDAGAHQAREPVASWLSSFAYVLMCAVRRISLAGTKLAQATCGTIRLKLLKIGALVTIRARRVKLAFASACPECEVFETAARHL